MNNFNFSKQRYSTFLLLFLFLLFCSNCLAETNEYRREECNKTFKASLDLGVPDIQNIKSKLIFEEYEAVEKIFEDLLTNYQKNVIYESPLTRGFWLFDSKNNISISSLNTWVEKSGSAIAYAARGAYYALEGYHSRGTKFISETSNESIDGMIKFHIKAVPDLLKAIEINPQLIPVYAWLIQITNSSYAGYTGKEILDKALNIDNRTYYVRYQYMVSLMPKWGGSLQRMEKFAKKTSLLANLNPQLWSFLGDVDAYKGEVYYRNQDFTNAVEMYTSALQYGDCLSWLECRAGCYYYLEQFDKAVEDFDRILHYKPNDQKANKWVQISKIEQLRRN